MKYLVMWKVYTDIGGIKWLYHVFKIADIFRITLPKAEENMI